MKSCNLLRKMPVVHRPETSQAKVDSLIPLDSNTPQGRTDIYTYLHTVRPIHRHRLYSALGQRTRTNEGRAV